MVWLSESSMRTDGRFGGAPSTGAAFIIGQARERDCEEQAS